MYYVYVIRNEENKRYIGYTTNLKERLEAHNKGINRSTKDRKWELVYYEAYKSKSDAMRRERSLKNSGQGRRFLWERIKESLES